MLEELLRSLFIFAAGLFLVFNSPLWLSTRATVFASGPQVPIWIGQAVSWTSRLGGIAVLVAGAWDATHHLIPALLISLVIAIGLFCLIDGPIWLITWGSIFHRGRKSPVWLEKAGIFYIRMVGYVTLLGGMAAGITVATT